MTVGGMGFIPERLLMMMMMIHMCSACHHQAARLPHGYSQGHTSTSLHSSLAPVGCSSSQRLPACHGRCGVSREQRASCAPPPGRESSHPGCRDTSPGPPPAPHIQIQAQIHQGPPQHAAADTWRPAEAHDSQRVSGLIREEGIVRVGAGKTSKTLNIGWNSCSGLSCSSSTCSFAPASAETVPVVAVL